MEFEPAISLGRPKRESDSGMVSTFLSDCNVLFFGTILTILDSSVMWHTDGILACFNAIFREEPAWLGTAKARRQPFLLVERW